MSNTTPQSSLVPFDVGSAELTGRWLVEASAGTGKTYALERIVLRLVLEENIAIDRILVVTFTKAATAELRERVRALFHKADAALSDPDTPGEFDDFFARARAKGLDPQALLDVALTHFDEASILTIHGFCQKMLSEFLFTRGGSYDVEFSGSTGFEAKVTEEFLRHELPALTDEQRSIVLGWQSLTALLGKLCERGGSVAPAAMSDIGELQDPVLAALFDRFITQAPARVAELERLHGVKSFASLLTDMYELVQSDPAAAERIRSRYEAVLVDEFQDTDRVQYRIFKDLFLVDKPSAPKSVFFVGDPKQAIYSFRGAELDVYLRARGDIEAMQTDDGRGGLQTLATNYRSAPALMGAVNAFFADDDPTESSFLTSDIRYGELQAGAKAAPLVRVRDGVPSVVPVLSLWVDDGSLEGLKIDLVRETEVKYMADDIASLLDGSVYLWRDGHWRAVRAGDIAVLVRKRVQADLLSHELMRHGVRTLLDENTSVFATAEAADVTAVFEAMLSPTDTRRFATARSGRLIGRTIRQMREQPEAAGADRALLKEASERFERFGPAAALSYIAKERELQQRLLPVKDGAAKLMNYEQLSELLQDQYRRLGTLGAVLRVMQRLKSADGCEESYKVRRSNDENVVRIVTIHSSKGLEYPIVYLAQAEALKAGPKDNSTCWSADAGQGSAVNVRPNAKSDETATAGKLCNLERIRLAYVAMTRASSRLVVPLLIAGNGGAQSWKSACNAYLQAMTGLTEPAGREKQYEAVLKTIDSAVQKVRERYVEMTQQNAALLDVTKLNETLLRDLGPMLKSPLAEAGPEAFLEVCAGVDPAGVVPPAQSRHVQALDPVAVQSAWQRSSFTAISTGLGAARSEEFEAEEFEGQNALIEPDEEARLTPTGSGQSADLPPEPPIEANDQDPALLMAQSLLRGAEAGDWIHKLLERVMNADPQEREAVLENIKPFLAATTLLGRAGAGERQTVLEAAAKLAEDYVRNTLTCDFFNAATIGVSSEEMPEPFVLNTLDYGTRQCEMPFLLSVPNARAKESDVARVMSANGFAMQPIRDGALSGYLTGAIDMVFCANGRYYILDWKSNWLGSQTRDYSQAAMREEIDRKHYALQYVIYLTALKRHLIACAGYTEENVWEAIGGAFYVFVRGIDALTPLDEKGARTGVFFDRPQAAVDALDALLKGADSHE